jgi:hypothetical protein
VSQQSFSAEGTIAERSQGRRKTSTVTIGQCGRLLRRLWEEWTMEEGDGKRDLLGSEYVSS